MNKRFNKKKIGIFALILILIIVGIVVAFPNNKQDDVKIGAILPLSGDYSIIGTEIKNGMELAKYEIAMDGFDVNIIYEDDESFLPRAVVNAANKLVNIDKVDVALTAIVEEAKPSSNIFNDNEVPLVIVWDSNRYIKEGGNYF